MRVAIVVAVACLSAVGICAGQDAKASITKYTNIPAQELVPALKTLAHQRGFHVVFLAEVVGNRHTQGAVGDLTTTEALTRLLEGTNLGYSYLDDKTVTILPVNSNNKLDGQGPSAGNLHRCSGLSSDKLDYATSLNQTSLGSTAVNWTGSEGASDCVESYSQENLRLASAVAGADAEPVQNSDGESNLNKESTTKAEELQEVVVTGKYQFLSADTSGATNLPLPIEQVPQSISLVSNDFIKAADLKTLGEIAEYTPGAINQGNPGNSATSISLRGFAAGRSIDGVNVLGNLFFEPEYAIYDRLEIVKGPSSVVYGVSSPGGLVNYVTKSATLQTPSYLLAQAGSWSSYRVEGQIAGALDADGHARAIGLVVHDQGDSFMDQMYHKTTSLYGGLNVDLGSSVTAYLHGGYQRQETPSFNGIPTESDGSPPPLPRSFYLGSTSNGGVTTDVYHAEADLTWHATEMLDLGIKGNYLHVGIAGPQYNSYGLQSNGDLGVGAYTIVGRQQNYGIGASSIYRMDNLGLKNSFVSLAALYQNSYDNPVFGSFNNGTANIFDGEAAVSRVFDSLLALGGPPILSRAAASTLTFSGQSNLQVIERLNILLGVSYSKAKASGGLFTFQAVDFPGQTSYRGGLTYEVVPRTYAYISYSQSFFPQLGIDANGRVFPPIKGDQYEFGLKYRAEGGRLLLTAAAFQIREKNVPEPGAFAGGVLYLAPIGEQTYKGIELQALGQLTPEWQINAGYTYLDPKITVAAESLSATVGETALFLPKQTFSLFSIYTLRDNVLKGLSFGGGVRYVGPEQTSYSTLLANQQANPNFQATPGFTKPIPGYTLVDLNLGYAWDKWIVQLSLHNALDRHYFINQLQTLFQGNQIGDPTNVALSIRRTF